MLNPDPIVEVDFSGVIHSATPPQFSGKNRAHFLSFS
jgi:hypothetical protein